MVAVLGTCTWYNGYVLCIMWNKTITCREVNNIILNIDNINMICYLLSSTNATVEMETSGNEMDRKPNSTFWFRPHLRSKFVFRSNIALYCSMLCRPYSPRFLWWSSLWVTRYDEKPLVHIIGGRGHGDDREIERRWDNMIVHVDAGSCSEPPTSTIPTDRGTRANICSTVRGIQYIWEFWIFRAKSRILHSSQQEEMKILPHGEFPLPPKWEFRKFCKRR